MNLPVLATETALEEAADPATFVVLACERAKTWLAQALEQGDIEAIVELKSQAEAIRIYTAQKQIGKDAELSAAEIVRRAERGLGIAVKRGQEAGEIARPSRTTGPNRQPVKLPVPAEYFNGEAERTDAYSLADATEEQFETGLTEAKDEGNLSRANVIRKVGKQKVLNGSVNIRSQTTQQRADRLNRMRKMASEGFTSRQMAAEFGISGDHVRKLCRDNDIGIPADVVVGKPKQIDSNRVVSQTVIDLEGIVLGLNLVELDDLDPERVEGWANSLSNSLRSLNGLVKKLKEKAQ